MEDNLLYSESTDLNVNLSSTKSGVRVSIREKERKKKKSRTTIAKSERSLRDIYPNAIDFTWILIRSNQLQKDGLCLLDKQKKN